MLMIQLMLNFFNINIHLKSLIYIKVINFFYTIQQNIIFNIHKIIRLNKKSKRISVLLDKTFTLFSSSKITNK